MCATFKSCCAAQVTYQQLAPALQVTLLNNYLTSTLINPLLKATINLLTGGLPITEALLSNPLIQGVLASLSPITVDAAAIATTTIPNTPVGTCTALTVAYVGEKSLPLIALANAVLACRPCFPVPNPMPSSKS